MNTEDKYFKIREAYVFYITWHGKLFIADNGKYIWRKKKAAINALIYSLGKSEVESGKFSDYELHKIKLE